MYKCVVMFLVLLVGCSSAPQQTIPNPTATVDDQALVVATETQAPVEVLPTETLIAPTPTAAATATVAVPTPAPQPKVGVQVGHWLTEEVPDELERFRTSTGAFAAGVSEVEVNLPIAQRVVELLQAEGINAELIPATVPISYDADVFISIHADGSPSESKGGFKMATPWRASEASKQLLNALETEYAVGTGFARDTAVTFNMRGYYAFSWWRRQHAIAKTTPAVIVEMGFLTNPYERSLMLNDPDFFARSITNGVLRYLNERDPNDVEARIPQEHPIHRASVEGVPVYSSPNANSEIIGRMELTDRLVPFQLQDGWYEGVVRGKWRTVGWVQVEALVATDDPLPGPSTAPAPTGN